jgi:hypothetical protein
VAKLDVYAVVAVGIGNNPVIQFAVHDSDGSPVDDLKIDNVTIALTAAVGWAGWDELKIDPNSFDQFHPGAYSAWIWPPPPYTDWASPALLDAVIAVEVVRDTDRGFSYACTCAYSATEGHFWTTSKGRAMMSELRFDPSLLREREQPVGEQPAES